MSADAPRIYFQRAADQLQISRHALRYRMQRLNLQQAGDAGDPAGDPTPPHR